MAIYVTLEGKIPRTPSRELSRRFTENVDFSILIIDLSQAKLIGTTTSVMIVDLVDRTKANNKKVLVITGNDKIKQSLHKLNLDILLDKKYQFHSKEQALLSLEKAIN